MSVPLKRIDLLLDEDLIRRLEEESRLRQASVSDVVRNFLARDLGMTQATHGFVERIRRLREAMGSFPPDGTEIIRESRDRGW
jgi:uncharacterized protein (UPF0335 family)